MNKIKLENLEFYLALVNRMQPTELWLNRSNGTNYLCKKKGNESIFNGTITECYYFLLGISRLSLVDPFQSRYLVNSNYRVYQVVDSLSRQYFCNIEDLNTVIKTNDLKPGYFKIYHFWNNKAVKVSKKDLKSFFEGSQLKQEFSY